MDASDASPREGRRRFGVFEFQLCTGELSKDGRPVALRPQAQRLLALLVASAGTVVSRAEIQRELWSGDTFVDFDQGVNHAIRELRAALGDVADAPRFIQTVPRRGYRFVPVSAPDGAPPSIVVSAPAVDPSPRAADREPRARGRWLAGAAGAVLMGALAVAFFVLRSSAGASPTPPATLATSARSSRRAPIHRSARAWRMRSRRDWEGSRP